MCLLLREANYLRTYLLTYLLLFSGKGKILVKDFEIGTYDEHKKPICLSGKPQFTFPGHFKVLKGENS